MKVRGASKRLTFLPKNLTVDSYPTMINLDQPDDQDSIGFHGL